MLYEKNVCIGDDRLLSVEKRIFKDFTIPVHLHDYYEIEIIVSGVGVSEFDGVSYNLCPGMAFFITPNDFHNFKSFFSFVINIINICKFLGFAFCRNFKCTTII